MAIKAQAFIDFNAEYSFLEDMEIDKQVKEISASDEGQSVEGPAWTLFIDGSFT